LINTGKVRSSVGLFGFGVKGERIHSDTGGLGHASVVFVGLVTSEIVTVALSETVLAVDLKLAVGSEGVKAADISLVSEDGIGTSAGEILSPGVFVGAEVIPLVGVGGIIFTDNPHEFHAGVVEGKLGANGGSGDGFLASVLNLGNEVFVRFLGSDAAFSGLKENVVNPELSINEAAGLGGGKGRGDGAGGGKRVKFRERAEFEGDANLVVLESNKGKRKSGVFVEPETGNEVHLGGGVRNLGGLETVGLGGVSGGITGSNTDEGGFIVN
jgi:hypothetical protein